MVIYFFVYDRVHDFYIETDWSQTTGQIGPAHVRAESNCIRANLYHMDDMRLDG